MHRLMSAPTGPVGVLSAGSGRVSWHSAGLVAAALAHALVLAALSTEIRQPAQQTEPSVVEMIEIPPVAEAKPAAEPPPDPSTAESGTAEPTTAEPAIAPATVAPIISETSPPLTAAPEAPSKPADPAPATQPVAETLPAAPAVLPDVAPDLQHVAEAAPEKPMPAPLQVAQAPPEALADSAPTLPPPDLAPPLASQPVVASPPRHVATRKVSLPRPAAPPPAGRLAGSARPETTAASAPASEQAASINAQEDRRVKETLAGRIRNAVQDAVQCPAAARMMSQSGRAGVAFDYRNGALVGGLQLARSSGMSVLDASALSAVRSAHYPEAPPEASNQVLHLLIWVEESCSG